MAAAAQVQSRVTVVAPRTRVDMALPLDLTIGELLPFVLDMVGERDAAGMEHDGWCLALDDGSRLDMAHTLRSLDILDGTLLRLVPRGVAEPPPIYDDVVDVIARTVRDRHDRRTLRSVTGAAISGTMLLIAGIVLFHSTSQFGNELMALGTVAAIIAAATAIERVGEHLLAGTLAVAGGGHVILAGLLIIPGEPGFPGLLLGFMFSIVYALSMRALVPSATVPLTAIGISGLIGAGGSLVGVLVPATAGQIASGTGCIAVAVLTMLPWIVVRLARLPMPVVPRSATELGETDHGLDVTDAMQRAEMASTYHTGMVIGCTVTAGVSVATLIHSGNLVSSILAAVIVAIMLMRIRRMDHRDTKLAIVITMLIGSVLGVGSILSVNPGLAGAPLFLGFFLIAAGAVATTMLPQTNINPLTARALDIGESLLIVSLVPLAVGAANLYSVVRHL
ncbi:type VII secretion integral membrane protein EccD [Austwickia chelonae]|uniref:type VII secretion integral membrane protein EccD n=1 Tax=Austwickia chelonae TaxID=100225 RepID=UPI0013C2DDA4|nr:type VII secretion integral membrane protein EccD [Austwickia chelonae]